MTEPDGAEPDDTRDSSSVPDSDSGHRDDGLDLASSIARAYRRTGTSGADAQPSRRSSARRNRSRRQPPAATGTHPDDRDPQTLEATMDRLVAEHGWKTDVAVHAMFARWNSIVGAEVAQHCTPQRFADGELYVDADSTAWATQLRLLAPTVVAKMNEQLGDGTILRVKVTGPQGPSWKKGARSVRGRGPRDTYG